MKNLLEATQAVDRELSSARGGPGNPKYENDFIKEIEAMEFLDQEIDVLGDDIKTASAAGDMDTVKMFEKRVAAFKEVTKILRKALG